MPSRDDQEDLHKFKVSIRMVGKKGFTVSDFERGCWCQMGWTEYFRLCWSTGIFHNHLLSLQRMVQKSIKKKSYWCHRSEENGQIASGINNMKALNQWFTLLVWRIDVFKRHSISAVRPYMSTVCSTSDEYFQIDNGTNFSKLRS